ncbi:DEAD/DEAH box helicase [Rhodovarius crocodyli]|uniref:DEAD/DEAH box helicase n=1 Tax=Rhodovarius crocodyli TaxID=1979269 RepID=A0A437MP83_9PROT|nr:DEAD/DEAH box helicase [Rhodovarius crocodyli]RVT99450.1 DEAD/DEAH box helicase [Rhodovarius crocodyli]
MPFSRLPAPLAAALTARGYTPTPVQSAVLEAPTDRDLLVSARTGSGKTVAFGVAIAANLLGDATRLPPAGAPLALVIAPTRELALQVRTELTWLYAEAGGRVGGAVGGMDPMTERRAFQHGVHIVVGTPGRVRDHIERGNLPTEGLRAVVLDEADEMLDLGFREELEAILDAAPPERRTLMFSATVPRPIAQLAKSYQKDALRLEVNSANEQHGDITYRAALIAPQDSERAVVNALRFENPRLAMVFCATRAEVARLSSSLAERGFPAVALSGEMSQAERNRALQMLRDGRAKVCVATDVAARGIDLPELGLVIHADLPRDPETLQHRSGRTGRAGRKGVSMMLVPVNKRRIAERLLAAARVQAEWGPAPDAEAVRGRDNERLVEEAKTLLETPAEENDVAIAGFIDAPRDALAAALIKLLRGPLPAPEELADVSPNAARPERAMRREDNPNAVWFHTNVGRQDGADPKWLLPFLCRRGHVTRDMIGRIRILGNETQFEVSAQVAQRFAEAARKGDGKDADVLVEPMDALPRAPHSGPRPEYRQRPRSEGGYPPRAASRAEPRGEGPRRYRK